MPWNIVTVLQGPVSISETTSFHKISSSLEAARLVSRIVRSLWNLTDTSAALLPMCLSNFKAIRRFKSTIFVASRLHEILRKDVISDIETGPCCLIVVIPLFLTNSCPAFAHIFQGCFAILIWLPQCLWINPGLPRWQWNYPAWYG